MIDMEKVLISLKACAREDVTVSCSDAGCAYWNDDNCTGKMARDALELLKAQEAVKVVRRVEETEWNVCGNCGSHLISKWKWCPYCGKEVNWNGIQ